ncbi:MAG TPA: flavin reductase family protein [Pseudonocardiaceae bacterium]|nr:flavin reductase family protein [Pseudonocardiaceae bacterium]
MSISRSNRLLDDPVGEEGFRALMANFPSSVTIVTTIGAGGLPHGLTCSSLASVSLRPPTLLVCVRSTSPTLAAIVHSGTLAVNLLHAGAQAEAELFSSGTPDRFSRVDWAQPAGAGGPHLVAAAHLVADCRVSDTKQVGDHVVVFGEVLGVATCAVGERRPLLYGMRCYVAWSPEPPLQ